MSAEPPAAERSPDATFVPGPGVPLSLVVFTCGIEVVKGVFFDRVEPAKSPRGYNEERPHVTAVRDGAYIRLSTGQVFHVAGCRVSYWVEET